jgi:hypothetical protein
MTKQFYKMQEKAYDEFWEEENLLNPKPKPQGWLDYLNPLNYSKEESFEGGTTKGEFEMTEFGSSTYHNSTSNSRQ